jgi:hypothetical protein
VALTLNDVILGVRGRSPAFSKPNVPDASLARYLTGYQRTLVSKALQVDKTFLAQQMSVGFDMSSANATGTVGAGTVGGRPIDSALGATSAVNLPVGSASQVDVDGTDVSTLVSESVVASATASTLTKTGAGWTTNAYQNYTVVIVAGTGAGQRRTVSSNTSTVLTVSQDWVTTPDTTSLFVVVDEVIESDYTFGAVADTTFSAERVGYLVRVNAAGSAYLDYTLPLVARYDVGIPLPQHHLLIGGTVRASGDDDAALPLTFVDYQSRFQPNGLYGVYEMGGQLYLCGNGGDWENVLSLDLRYIPVPPALTALTDYFLVSETAYQPLVDAGAYHAALRVSGQPNVQSGLAQEMLAAKMESERAWVREVSAGKRNRFTVIKEWNGI